MPAKTKILVLSHPNEKNRKNSSLEAIGTIFENIVIKTGHRFRWANIKKLFSPEIDPSRWAVLYLGTKTESPLPKKSETDKIFSVLKKGIVEELDIEINSYDGIIALDGNWSESKTIWWANPWLMKFDRIALAPKERSLYKNVRKEPRSECLSTLEAIVVTASILEKNPQIRKTGFEEFKKSLALSK